MIVPMKKVSLILQGKNRKKSLEMLRKAGVIHLEDLAGHSDDLVQLKNDHSKLESANIILSELKLSKQQTKIKSIATSFDESLEKAIEVNNLFARKKFLEEETVKNFREIERFRNWGNVNPADFALLAKKNIYLALYEIPTAAYALIPDTIQTLFVNEDKTQKRLLVVQNDENRPVGLPAEAFAVPSAEKATVHLEQEIQSFSTEVQKINENIAALYAYKASIANALAVRAKEIEFENVYAGMAVEDSLAWLTGFVPVPNVEELKTLAKTNNWAIMLDDPAEDDNVPTQLKNSRIVQLLYPLLDFLGTVPGYREFDISAWFLFFFSIFFAMIFGDAGYGSLTLLIALVAIIKTKTQGKTIPLALQLLTLISCTTIIWGSINCTWFGISYDYLPPVLQNLALPAFSPKNPASSTNVQIFCFILAVSQLSIAHLVAFLRNVTLKSLKMLADLGSLAILWGMFFVVLNLLVSAERFPITNIILSMIAGGFAASFIFSNYEGNILKSILASLVNIISVLLGVINFFSDVVSYIRLWAVGLAGAAIAQTVNQMAGPMLGGFIMFAGVLLLIFGHGLNMILNVLSVIVHGVRLNTLEFTGHVGMAWSGFKYAPFKE